MHEYFRKIAQKTSEAMGTSWAFAIAFFVVLFWALSGPVFGFSDTWQLVINTGTTILTFLMVFLIQNTQNRDARATQLKLDELIRAIDPARNRLIDIENMDDGEIQLLQNEFKNFHEQKVAEIKAKRSKSKNQV